MDERFLKARNEALLYLSEHLSDRDYVLAEKIIDTFLDFIEE